MLGANPHFPEKQLLQRRREMLVQAAMANPKSSGSDERVSGKKRPREAAVTQGGRASEKAASQEQPPKKRSKRRRHRPADDSQLDADERERRRVQRELRDLAVKLRGDGSEYKPQKYKRKLYLASGAGTARRERKKEKTEQKSKVRVVVLPIFWKERADEMEAVLAAAKKVESLLSVLGVRVVTDTNNEFKPGERMKHWETLGVPIRVEIGPQDVKRGSCMVAVAGEAGTVAQKTSVRLSHKLVKKVRVLLQAAGVEVQSPASSKKAAAEGEGMGEGEDAAGGKGEDESDDDDEEEGVATAGAKEAGGSDAAERRHSGNDAGESGEDDAGGDDMDLFNLEVEAEEETLTMSKKQLAKKKRQEDRAKRKEKKKNAKKGSGGAGAADELPGWEDKEKKVAKKSKAKVVVF